MMTLQFPFWGDIIITYRNDIFTRNIILPCNEITLDDTTRAGDRSVWNKESTLFLTSLFRSLSVRLMKYVHKISTEHDPLKGTVFNNPFL
jgi:hypothetical protein